MDKVSISYLFSFSRYQTKCVRVLIQTTDDVMNFKIYLQSSSKAKADRQKKREGQKYKLFRSIIIPRNGSFNSLLQVFQTFHFIVYSQSDDSQKLLLLCYYRLLAVHNSLIVSNQNLSHNKSNVNHKISKNYYDI